MSEVVSNYLNQDNN